jgi:D-3-phosphoglycerate dehydrogenase
MSLRALITCRQMQNCFHEFRDAFAQAGINPYLPRIPGQQLSAEELTRLIETYDGVIAGDDHFTRPVLENAHQLRVISKWGVGLDAIDRDAASELGIAVTNTPNMFDDEVADVTIGYLIMLVRGLHRIDHAVRAGEWLQIEGRSLAGATLGVVGLGGIGRATARRAKAMGMTVLGADPSASAADAARQLGVCVVGFGDLMRKSDAVALNCPLTHETRGLLGTEALALARENLLVINTARGPVVDEGALIEGLRSGHIAGAALDVFEHEPVPRESPLRSMERVILGSHNASNTRQAVLRTSARAVDNLFRHLGVGT